VSTNNIDYSYFIIHIYYTTMITKAEYDTIASDKN